MIRIMYRVLHVFLRILRLISLLRLRIILILLSRIRLRIMRRRPLLIVIRLICYYS